MTTGRAGSGSSRVDGGMAIRRSLVNAMGAPAAMQRRALRTYSGPGVSQHGTQKVKHADNVVLEVRRLAEQAHLPKPKIVEHLAELGVDINFADVRRYVDYQTRALLVPAENAAPYIDRIEL